MVTVKELKQTAKERGFSGYSSLSKDQLLSLLTGKRKSFKKSTPVKRQPANKRQSTRTVYKKASTKKSPTKRKSPTKKATPVKRQLVNTTKSDADKEFWNFVKKVGWMTEKTEYNLNKIYTSFTNKKELINYVNRMETIFRDKYKHLYKTLEPYWIGNKTPKIELSDDSFHDMLTSKIGSGQRVYDNMHNPNFAHNASVIGDWEEGFDYIFDDLRKGPQSEKIQCAQQ